MSVNSSMTASLRGVSSHHHIHQRQFSCGLGSGSSCHHRRHHCGNRNVSFVCCASAEETPADEKVNVRAELAKMRADMAMSGKSPNMSPELSDYVNGLVELTQQEFGLYGVAFSEVMQIIDRAYVYTPTTFVNGVDTDEQVVNNAGENNGSAKVFGFGRMHGLNQEQTLRLFCEHYESVKANPDGTDHGNIRAFMKHGWNGVSFEDGEDADRPLRVRAEGEIDDADI
ncbi:hypothetical protein PPROV_000821300 [Pycnococcus provasolii]|uniref:HopJ type III effector protein n=1 Tax=Pycnococcus provasolii TaxID=41880 RepID=A0A830HRA5_9CHLO|nr:hypothetical protein PPROV_000821300 [Pycnococcus provasolii]